MSRIESVFARPEDLLLKEKFSAEEHFKQETADPNLFYTIPFTGGDPFLWTLEQLSGIPSSAKIQQEGGCN